MDANTAVVVVAAISAISSIAAAAIGAWAAIQSAANGRVLGGLVPTVAKLEVNTNSMTAEIARLAKKEGDTIGEARGRRDANAEGVARAEGLKDGLAQPQSPSPAKASANPASGDEIKLDDVDSLKLK